MKIYLSPVRSDARLSISVQGDVININDQELDFSDLKQGDRIAKDATKCKWIVSDVVRGEMGVELTLILPHGPNPPAATRFPEPINVTADGKVDLPPANLPSIQEVNDD